MFLIIERHNYETTPFCYLNDCEEIEEFFEKQNKYFKSKGYWNVAKRRGRKGCLKYFNFRHTKRVNRNKIVDYYSYQILPASKKKVIDDYMNKNELFGKVNNLEKRSKNMCFRFGELEYKFLENLANKYNLKPIDIIRASITNTFNKELEKFIKDINE